MAPPNIKTLVDKLILMFFGKSYCPFCRQAKQLLTDKGLTFKIYEIDLQSEGADVQAYLLEKTGQRTVPNIFINGQHLGGHSDLVAASTSGKLDKMLQGRTEL
ncbi:hypothetical protein DFQ27_006417 [Actinomortierella ambigua]|uniref:Glutaredoxin domain-containing protein n=1 Tax=Actinomortierella ambigua TaxID=1343610 RepID=A0A9P6PWE0_9FUNG|nr:hypothetical protein DFQ26_007212 [Actinomortierella ambigua]KAG0255127.1 hypothetical protein DFQ27_006417 [Actinomortierella ambigua]